MKVIGGILLKFLLSVMGIIFIGGFPVLLSGLGERELRVREYWQSVKEIVYALFHTGDLTYMVIGGQKERDLFPYLWEPIIYSLIVLFSAFLLASFLSISLTILTMLFSEKNRNRIKFFFYLFESIPDVLVILLSQLFILALYKQTGILFFEIASVATEKIYLLPILVLAILPTVQLFRVSILSFESEERKDYVTLAQSIGLGKLPILTFHILRNAIISVFFQSKKTVWFMLSNLFVLELLFNIAGITRFLKSTLQPKMFTIAILSIFIPLFIFYSVGEVVLSKKANKGEEI
ncbi:MULTISPECIES: ABC transporter permease subunit [Bacillaceae]|uniref:ABC transporter permease subunit n=1 Tax=Bacillaceae TaxID=186817 RepID=UPI001C58E35D|nr:ABC transporter permease subunit [Rossellomorea sp. YZS02]MBW3111237.1 ABC transporter permease subunit [Bacillus sp. MCCB 382]MDX8345245.1 ABC transporter permease subunit [Rossellomorea sp. YZS02]